MGLITTATITHASPAALYAKTPDRNWQADVNVPAEARDLGCLDIAEQFVQNNNIQASRSPPPPGGGAVLPYLLHAYWVCAARETPIFSPKFLVRSIIIFTYMYFKIFRSGASPFYTIFFPFRRT